MASASGECSDQRREHASAADHRSGHVRCGLAGLVTVVPVGAAAKQKQVDQITCDESLALDPDDQQRIAYWIDGYQAAKGEGCRRTVAFDKFGQPVGALVEDCKATPKETLWQKLKKHL